MASAVPAGEGRRGWMTHRATRFLAEVAAGVISRDSPSEALCGLVDAEGPLCAAPNYLARYGQPQTPGDLQKHHCLRFLGERIQNEWPLIGADGQDVIATVSGVFDCDDSRGLGDAVYADLGIGVRPQRVTALLELLRGASAEVL